MIAICALLFFAHNCYSQSVIQTDSGPVRGFIDNNATIYLGIPFAAPPIGELRWKPPQPPKSWTSVLNANSFVTSCKN